MRIAYLLSGDRGLPRYACFLLFLQERHHGTKLFADSLYQLAVLRLAHVEETVASGFIFRNPLFRKFTRLNLGQNALHLGAGLIVDDARSACVIAVLGGIRNREAHVIEAALVDQIDNQLQFMQTFKIGDLGSIPGIDQRLEAGANQFRRAAAEDSLLAEQIAFGFFAERSFENTG